MSKRILIIVSVALLALISLGVFRWHEDAALNGLAISKEDMAKRLDDFYRQSNRQSNTNASVTQTMPVPIDLSKPVRLAIGGLGFADEGKNQELGDLVTVQLTGEQGFDLVERRSMKLIMQELNLSWSGFVRAKDAVRAGKLLKADWFLLGTEAKISGTNSIVARVVDARTGVMRDAGVFSADKPPVQLAADLASFMRQGRQNAAHPKMRVYLAVGAFEDLSVNNRRADFPAQLRGYLTVAYRGSSMTLLEREYVETLLQEVRLDLAGLTEEDESNPPPALQSAFWLVSGQYQSYETTNLQVELSLEVQRIFGKSWRSNLRGLPGESMDQQVKMAIDQVMNQNSGAITPTHMSEAGRQMDIGKELSRVVINHFQWPDDLDLVQVKQDWELDPQLVPRQKRNLEEAMRAFDTVLLLKPANREAKMYLAACLQNSVTYHMEDARNYYWQIIDEPAQDKWSGLAQRALVDSFRYSSAEERAQWFAKALQNNTNSAADEFYRQNAEIASRDNAIAQGGSDSSKLAQNRLLDRLHSSTHYGDFALHEFQSAFADQAAAAKAMAEFLPTLIKSFPELAPYLAADILSYQMDTNSSVLLEFEKQLDWCLVHPKEVVRPGFYWSETAQPAFGWLMKHRQYNLAAKTLETYRATAGLDNERQVELGFAYMSAERWKEALGVFAGLSNSPVLMNSDGPWGQVSHYVLTGKEANYCRIKLDLPVVTDPREFDLGKPVFCLCTPSTFAIDEDGLWVGIGSRLLHLDFDLKTNLDVKLPMDDSVPITALCVASGKIWIGTQGAGLIAFDKASRQCRRFTEADGLMMDSLASLEVAGDSLWIGYGGATIGGLGMLDLSSQKLTSFMPSLNPRTGAEAPRRPIRDIVVGPDGDLQMRVDDSVWQFHVASGAWKTLPKQAGDWATSLTADAHHLAEGGPINLVELDIESKPTITTSTNKANRRTLVVSSAELSRLDANFRTNGNHERINGIHSGNIRPKGGLAIQNLRDHQWQHLEDADGFPNPPTTLTLDENNLWVGGEGAIALVDLAAGKVRKFSRIAAPGVDRIQIGGGYVWAQFDWHLYRAPLSALQ